VPVEARRRNGQGAGRRQRSKNELTEFVLRNGAGLLARCERRATGLCPRNAERSNRMRRGQLGRDVEAWPVGWELSDQSPRDTLPVLYEFHNATW